MTGQVQIVDAVGAGQHPADEAARLDHPVLRVHREVLAKQVVQARGLGQEKHRDQKVPA
ncbi:hypothetical protein [Nocardioides sp. InS609-2]|uniref:hypothetical protein n=1 Tax=Nocardioides sp. InS609-2 TaxID=2760705 RepID=UPI0020BF982F|nr:hypothetical protein [Nocardioides sp. InS609-2]